MEASLTYKQNILFLAGLHNELRVKTRMIESKQSFIEICQNEDDLSVSVHHGQGRTVHCWEVKFVSNKLLYGGHIHHTDFLPKKYRWTKVCSNFKVQIFFSPSYWMIIENLILYRISSSVQIIEQPELSLLKKKFYYFSYLFSIISTRFSLLLQIRNILQYSAKSLWRYYWLACFHWNILAVWC